MSKPEGLLSLVIVIRRGWMMTLLEGVSLACAQPTLDQLALAQLPSWSQPLVRGRVLEQYLFDLSINPFFQSGDLDNDGFLDLAVLVRDLQTGQRGVALVLHADAEPYLLDQKHGLTVDLSWLALWHVERRLPAGAGLEHEGHILVLSGLNETSIWVVRNASAWRTVTPCHQGLRPLTKTPFLALP